MGSFNQIPKPGPVRAVGRFIVRVYREFIADGCFPRAAGLSYTTLLSIIPILAVSFSMYSGFGQFEKNIGEVRQFLFEYINPSTIEALEGFQDQILLSSQKATAVGVLGLIALIMAAWALLNSVEKNFNAIWGVRRPRPLFRKFVAYTAFIFWIPILIAASIYLTDQLRDFFFSSEEALESQPLYRFSSYAFPFLFTWGAFCFANIAIPNCSVSWRNALIGSFIAGVLWELAKVGFDVYISKISSFKMIYGALGTIPLFLLWVYYSWLIVLLGGEITYVLSHPHDRRIRESGRASFSLYCGLRLMSEAARRFVQGQPPATAAELRKTVEVDEETSESVLSRLMADGLLVRSDDEPPVFVPGRSAEKIPLASIAQSVESDMFSLPAPARTPTDREIQRILDQAGQERQSILSRMTLANLLDADQPSPTTSAENKVEHGRQATMPPGFKPS